jgi:hypothetical protein
MDERELEARLSRRLRARFDTGAAPAALHDRVIRSLTAETVPAGGGWLARLAWPRQLVTVVAVVAVVALIALTLRFTQTPAPVTPRGSPTPSATSSSSAAPTSTPNPTPTPGPTVPPVSTTAWTGLDIQAISGPAAQVNVIPWSGGYLAIGMTTTQTSSNRGWISRDGRSWQQLPAATFGFDDPTGNTLLNSASACGSGVLVETVDGSGTVYLWYSTDGTTWTRSTFRNGGTGKLAANATGVIADVESGGSAASGASMALDFSSDCTTWQKVTLPGKGWFMGDLAATSSGFVAVGYTITTDAASAKAVAWYSSDGQQWSAAAIKGALGGEGFFQVSAGAAGFIAFSTTPGLTPGTERFWSSTDGRSWAVSTADPFGTVQQGEGSGAAAGTFMGDGTRLLGYGRPGTSPASDTPGQDEYFISADGVHWTKLTISGTGASTMLAGPPIVPSLMRDGVLFSSDSTSAWFGVATP